MQLLSVELPPLKISILATLWSTLIFQEVGFGKLASEINRSAALLLLILKSVQKFFNLLVRILLHGKIAVGEVAVGEIIDWGS